MVDCVSSGLYRLEEVFRFQVTVDAVDNNAFHFLSEVCCEGDGII